MIYFANGLDQDVEQLNVTLGLYTNTLMVFLKEIFETVDFENNKEAKKNIHFPSCQRVKDDCVKINFVSAQSAFIYCSSLWYYIKLALESQTLACFNTF